MTIFFYIVLMLASLVFFSMGAVIRSGKSGEPKPRIIDLIILIFLWGASICAVIFLDLNRWVLIAGWAVLCIVIGVVAASPGKSTSKPVASGQAPRNIFKKIWKGWERFTVKLGGFQTRMLLSLGFIIVISPIALAGLFTRDTQPAKNRSDSSRWLTREIPENSLEQFRKQS